MVQGYGSDSTMTTLLDQIDWYILPMFNPDGYEYTWSGVSSEKYNPNPYHNSNPSPNPYTQPLPKALPHF